MTGGLSTLGFGPDRHDTLHQGQLLNAITSVDAQSLASRTDVASSHFLILLTDRSEYQRTDTVSIVGASYDPSDSVTVTIVRQTTSTVVFSQTVTASPSGIVATTWKIPKNATIDNYSVSMTGTSNLAKNPPDLQSFSVNAAVISIASLSTAKSTYERT